jgi:hypothetical protein
MSEGISFYVKQECELLNYISIINIIDSNKLSFIHSSNTAGNLEWNGIQHYISKKYIWTSPKHLIDI